VKQDLKSEQGQVLGLVVVAMIAMLAMSALVMDVGFAWYAKRQLQASVDAAALAGAQAFPDNTQAVALAKDYLNRNNPKSRVSINTPDIQIGYLLNSRLHASQNKITVTETGSIPTTFAKVVGLDKFNFKVSSTACQPCGTKPFDIVVVIDRTASMCDQTDSGGCIDLNGAKTGFRTLMQTMDSKLDQIGLVDLPGVNTSASDPCGAVASVSGASPYDGPLISYLVDTMRTDYQLANGSPNTASNLYKHSVTGSSTSCIRAGGGTSYSQAIKTAVNELTAHGRANTTKIVIFMTDGAANVGPVWNCKANVNKNVPGCVSMAYNNYENTNPCQSSVDIAAQAKTNQHIIFYTIGYNLNQQPQDSICERGVWGTTSNPKSAPTDTSQNADWAQGHIQGSGCYTNSICKESPAITPVQTLQRIATDPNKYYTASSGHLDEVFAQIAADIESGTSRLANPAS
jgi:hypothetical protein